MRIKRNIRDGLFLALFVVLALRANHQLTLRQLWSPENIITVNKQQQRKPSRIRVLHLLGERHSGTTWMQEHLRDCFSHAVVVRTGLHRWKHWFQDNGNYKGRKSMVVVMFRDPIQWIEAMHTVSHHAPHHYGLSWREFVSKPWTMEYFGKDLTLLTKEQIEDNQVICQQQFGPKEVVPCLEEKFIPAINSDVVSMRPNYELRHDGSGQPYNSILELRRDKVQNFVDIKNYIGIQDYEAVRYEDVVQNGTEALIRRLEQALDIKAQCRPDPPKPLKLYSVGGEYLQWLNDHIDWSVEALIGYPRPKSSETVSSK